MAITNHERVGKAMEFLKSGIGPFVEREFANAYKGEAAARISRFLGEDRLKGKWGQEMGSGNGNKRKWGQATVIRY